MTAASLAFDQVSCRRGDRILFRGLSFSLMAGDSAIVTGPNGSGKSSLLRLAAGLLAPAGGAILRSGATGWLAEREALDTHLPLVEALAFWAAVDGLPPADVEPALEALDIAPLAEVPVRLLSTGQRRRAGLARIVLSKAPIWLLDEPANGLDANSVARLQAILERHVASGGILLAATHQPLGLTSLRTIELGSAR